MTAEEKEELDVALCSAISIYLIAERPRGATVGEIARLALGGRTLNDEVPQVSRAVSQLLREDLVVLKGGKVCPVLPE
ncbi:MAG: hypothetical protein JSS68_09100 [Actinobacteria bacterium]|nr:hypothetical protein [Actinomycetota bacterium]MBS1883954.1 hypothetical protein [Actinomycetota bacterium]